MVRRPLEFIVNNELECGWKGHSFQLENSLLQGLCGIVPEHWTDLLEDYRAMIELVIDKVNRTSRDFYSVVDNRLVNPKTIEALTGKSWDERRMNVDDSIEKIIGD